MAYWLVGYAILSLMVGTQMPAPLYEVYRREWDFSPGVLTLIFSTYAFFLVPSLLFFGALSDSVGRRRVLITGIAVAACGSAVFAVASGTTWLFVARAIQGVAVGMVSGVGAAALIELQPKGDRAVAALAATVATVGGGALGPILAGTLAQYGPWPKTLPYLFHLGMLFPALIGLVWAVPETSGKGLKRIPEWGLWRLQRPHLPAVIRRPFAIASATSFVAWAGTALFLSLAPSYVSVLLDIENPMVGGGVIFLVSAASLAAQLACRGASPQRLMVSGLILLATGLCGFVLAVPTHSFLLLLGSSLASGCGQGLAFMGAMTLVSQVAPPERRGDILSGFYVASYLGVGLPILGAGFGAGWIGLYPAMVIFAALVATSGLLLAFVATTDRSCKARF